jgi:hypothetical protein
MVLRSRFLLHHEGFDYLGHDRNNVVIGMKSERCFVHGFAAKAAGCLPMHKPCFPRLYPKHSWDSAVVGRICRSTLYGSPGPLSILVAVSMSVASAGSFYQIEQRFDVHSPVCGSRSARLDTLGSCTEIRLPLSPRWERRWVHAGGDDVGRRPAALSLMTGAVPLTCFNQTTTHCITPPKRLLERADTRVALFGPLSEYHSPDE